MWVRKIISGEAKGLVASLVRLLLIVPSMAYSLVAGVRNLLYDWGCLKSGSVSAGVICVGNITAGGTGKTPMILWLCRYLQGRGKKVALLSRGYGGGGGDNDEIRLIRDCVPELAIAVGTDRLGGGGRLVAQYHPDIILMDDGFQHRRMRRDLDIVMIDCTCPFGYGHILPRGLLRESPGQLRRAGVVVLSRSESVSEAELRALIKRVRGLMSVEAGGMEKPIVCCRHQPVGIYTTENRFVELSELAGKKVAAFCGIGNPESFVETLAGLGAEIVGRDFFSDHVRYDENVVSFLTSLMERSNSDWLMTTEKDWVKLKTLPAVRAMKALHWLKIEMVLTDGRVKLCGVLDKM